MSKTVKEHQAEADRIKKHVDDANALLEKMKRVANDARSTLEALKVFSPNDQFKARCPYHLRDRDSDEASMSAIIDRQVAQINALLGDRA